MKWSEEQYDQTYDFRTRTWYTEAITSPKDIIILLDISGSMTGTRRHMSMQVVNQILDTLNDNDFVNIYTFNNVTMPLVDCFNDTLFQVFNNVIKSIFMTVSFLNYAFFFFNFQ